MQRNRLQILVLATFGALLTAFAQAPTGEITGLVADATGAVVVGATVTLTNVATNTQRTIKSNTSGLYDLPALPPGIYAVKVEMQGFSGQVRTDVELQVGQVARLDFALKVGNVSEVVEVAGGAPVIETESTAVGTVIENKRILELPLNGRNFLQLASLTPGVTTNSAASGVGNTRQGGTRASFTLSAAGQRINLNHYTLDGLENTDPSFNSYIFLPSLDALQEFKVESGTFGAEYGHNMTQINVTTKGGTNQLHGAAFEFLRNSKLDAKNFFDRGDQPIPAFKRNQFGFTVGGPVFIPKILNGKDKLFFFFNYEGLRESKALTQTSTLPPSTFRAGDFSRESTIIYDPNTRVYNGSTVTAASPFPDNRIPADRIQSISSTYLKNWTPLPNLSSSSTIVANNFLSTEGRVTNGDQTSSRIDYNQSANSNFMFRYAHSGESQYLPNAQPDMGSVVLSQVHQGMLGHTWILGPTKVNEFKAGVSRLENILAPRRSSVEDAVGKLGGIPGIEHSNPLYWGVPTFQIGGGISNLGDDPNNPFDAWSTVIQVSDNFSWNHGKHSLKFGGDFRRTRYNVISGTVVRGRFSWNGAYTTNGAAGARTTAANNMADYLLGLISTSESQIGNPIANFRNWYLGFYFQDTWKITPKLTVNYGLRWEDETPWVDKHDAIVNIDFKWDNSIFPVFVRAGKGDPFEGNPSYPLPSTIPYVRDGRFGRGSFKNDNNDFGPRVGIAYSLNSKTVIRTGAGVYYVRDIASGSYEIVRNAPFSIRNQELADASRPNLTWQRPFSGSIIPSLPLGVEWNQPSSYVPQWSFGIQRQLDDNTSLELNYLGSAGVKLRRLVHYNAPPPGPGNANLNRPFPIFNGMFQIQNSSVHSNYHSLQGRLQRRLHKGLTVLSSFTYSKSIDNGSGVRAQGGDGAMPANPYDLRAERGVSAFDFRRRLTTSLLYELPIGKGKALLGSANRGVDAVLGGWQLGSILTLQDGFLVTPGCASAATVQNTGTACRPDATGISPFLPGDQRDPAHFFNLNAFVNRSPGGAAFRYGNASRNDVPSPGIIQWDLSLAKNFNFSEKRKIEFRSEFFNLPNHPIFGAPGATLGSATYGVIGSTRVDSREVQFGLRLVF